MTAAASGLPALPEPAGGRTRQAPQLSEWIAAPDIVTASAGFSGTARSSPSQSLRSMAIAVRSVFSVCCVVQATTSDMRRCGRCAPSANLSSSATDVNRGDPEWFRNEDVTVPCCGFDRALP